MSRNYILLFTGLALGLGWAIRGHFGHEWGASWAGAMGALALILVVNRKDWLAHAPTLAALGAAGWAIGGMMSYGIVIGYCRGTDYWNVIYGYTMLAVIGGLYGFMGGGFLGLGLASSADKKPDWAALISQMVAGAYLFWGFIIYQLEWFMTPPRSELWAACLGAAVALGWYLYREGYFNALSVALYSALGAGFGFAFGNFLQVLGSASGIAYNWWNVMEFTLGLCGGIGMAYAVLRNEWPKKAKPSSPTNWLALVFVFALIPFINYVNAFSGNKLSKLAEQFRIADSTSFVSRQQLFGGIILLVMALATAIVWRNFQRVTKKNNQLIGPFLFFACSFYYLLFSYIIKGFFIRPFSFGQSDTAYLPLLIVMGILWRFGAKKAQANPVFAAGISTKKSYRLFIALIISLLFIAFVSIQVHDGLGGMQTRF